MSLSEMARERVRWFGRLRFFREDASDGGGECGEQEVPAAATGAMDLGFHASFYALNAPLVTPVMNGLVA